MPPPAFTTPTSIPASAMTKPRKKLGFFVSPQGLIARPSADVDRVICASIIKYEKCMKSAGYVSEDMECIAQQVKI